MTHLGLYRDRDDHEATLLCTDDRWRRFDPPYDAIAALLNAHEDGAQRRGIGGRLLAAALAAFPTRSFARLEVEERNVNGREFYVKEGFAAVREQEVEAFATTLRVIVMERSASAVDDHSIP